MTTGSALDIGRAVAAGTTTASAVCEATLERIDREAGRLNAFITVAGERARARAEALDGAADPSRPLAGVPVADGRSGTDDVTRAAGSTSSHSPSRAPVIST